MYIQICSSVLLRMYNRQLTSESKDLKFKNLESVFILLYKVSFAIYIYTYFFFLIIFLRILNSHNFNSFQYFLENHQYAEFGYEYELDNFFPYPILRNIIGLFMQQNNISERKRVTYSRTMLTATEEEAE